jgi:hypothetical protein
VDSTPEWIAGLAIPVISTRFSHRSVLTGEELASARNYMAYGGLLVRSVSGGASLPPLLPVTSERFACSGPSMRCAALAYGFSLAPRRRPGRRRSLGVASGFTAN